MQVDDALKFMMSEKKFIHDYHKEDDYSDFQFISSWEKNYKSWISQNIFPVKIVKYEDLNNNTFNVFKDLIQFIDKTTNNKNDFDKKKAENSVQSSSFDELKNIEKADGFLETVSSKNESKKIPFFHLGPKNDWRTILNKDLKIKLEKLFEKELKELSYI